MPESANPASVLSRHPLTLLCLSLGALLAQTVARADVEHQYVVSVDQELRELRVEARFSRPINSVTARARDAGELLSDVQDCDTSKRLRMRNRRMMLPTGGIRCMNYTVNLARAAREERRNLSLSDDNILVSPSRWLWRPELDGDTTIRVRFELPEDVQVAVPWQRIEGRENEYLLGESPESANAPSLFGTFTSREISVPGATLHVSVPQTDPAIDETKILNWLRATATDVTLTYGRFRIRRRTSSLCRSAAVARRAAVPSRSGGSSVTAVRWSNCSSIRPGRLMTS